MANMELITSVTVGSGGVASVTLPATGTIPATYTDLKILCSTKTNRGTFNNDAINLNLNGSTSNITAIRLFGDGSSAYSQTNRGILNNAAASTSVFSNTEIYIPNYTSSNYKSISADSVTENNGTEAYAQLHAQLWSNTAAVTTAVLAPADGTLFLEGSTFYLYGISNVTSGSKATGGIVSSDGNYWYHMFPFSGTFTPTTAISADVLCIAGGGGGAALTGRGAGGAGGLLYHSSQSLTATGYTVTVGAGGTADNSGGNSQFGSLTASVGGGYGAGSAARGANGGAGGSGGGSNFAGTGGTATSGQGNAGGDSTSSPNYGGGGGGGAGAVGGTGTTSNGGAGGVGINTYLSFATATQTGANNGYYAAGGGAGIYSGGTAGQGGLGGGGNGSANTAVGTNAITNTGSGGGGGSQSYNGGNGGSGLVIIRYAI
jgi:hypothetical protein